MRFPQRILLVRLSHLGDVVHALGVFHSLHDAYPQARLAWAVQPEFAELVRALPGLERVLVFERLAGWRAWPRLARELRAFAPDLVVDAQGNLKSAAVALLSRAPRRAGPARADWRERSGALVLNDPAPRAQGPHAMDRMLALARHVAPGAAWPPRLDPAVAPGERAAAASLLDQRLPGAGPGDVLLKLSSAEDVRGWSVAGWCELAEALLAQGRRVLVLAGPAERVEGRQVGERLGARPGLDVWVEQSGLRELAALLEEAARRGLSYVGCDSGPLHLAAAVGLPVVALCGPTDAARTGPWPPEGAGPHRVVRARRAPECAPCLARRCTHPEGPVCLSRIPAADVLAALPPPPARPRSAGPASPATGRPCG